MKNKIFRTLSLAFLLASAFSSYGLPLYNFSAGEQVRLEQDFQAFENLQLSHFFVLNWRISDFMNIPTEGTSSPKEILKQFRIHVHGIVKSDAICGAGHAACVRHGQGLIFLTSNAFSESNLEMGRAIRWATLLHEFHHIASGSSHVPCNFDRGKECDADIGGAHGYTINVLMNIVKFCTNCSDELLNSLAVLLFHYFPRIEHGNIFLPIITDYCPKPMVFKYPEVSIIKRCQP